MKILVVVLTLSLLPCFAFAASGSSDGGHMHRLELNGFYGLEFVNPTNLNQHIGENNVSSTTRMNNITSLTGLGGELIYHFSPRFGLGARYTITSGTSGKGTLAGNPTEDKVDISDATLVAKYQMHHGRVTYQLGIAGGMATTFKITETIAGASKEYASSTNPIVGRAFLGVRANLGLLALFIEGGYQTVSSTEMKNNGTKLTLNSGSTVTADFSGGYALGGLGFNF